MKPAINHFSGSDTVADESGPIISSLLSGAAQQFFTFDASRKTKIILHIRFPTGHRLSLINYNRILPGTCQIYRCREAGQASAYDDDFRCHDGYGGSV